MHATRGLTTGARDLNRVLLIKHRTLYKSEDTFDTDSCQNFQLPCQEKFPLCGFIWYKKYS